MKIIFNIYNFNIFLLIFYYLSFYSKPPFFSGSALSLWRLLDLFIIFDVGSGNGGWDSAVRGEIENAERLEAFIVEMVDSMLSIIEVGNGESETAGEKKSCMEGGMIVSCPRTRGGKAGFWS